MSEKLHQVDMGRLTLWCEKQRERITEHQPTYRSLASEASNALGKNITSESVKNALNAMGVSYARKDDSLSDRLELLAQTVYALVEDVQMIKKQLSEVQS